MQYTAKNNKYQYLKKSYGSTNMVDNAKLNRFDKMQHSKSLLFFLFSSSNHSVKCVFLIHAFRRLTKCNPNATLLFLFQTDVSWICVLGWWFVVKWTFNQKTSISYFNYSKCKIANLSIRFIVITVFWLNMYANKWIIN